MIELRVRFLIRYKNCFSNEYSFKYKVRKFVFIGERCGF